MIPRWTACLLVALLGGCAAGAERVTLEQLATEPEAFDVADRVLVKGFPIRDGDSPVLLCSDLSPGRPPRATGRCVEAEGIPLTDAGGDDHYAGVWWDGERALDCLVVRGMPAPGHLERLVLSCVREGSRP